MAFGSPHITTTTVQATEFYDLSRQYRVSGVPKTVVSNGNEILGALPEEQFIDEACAHTREGCGGRGPNGRRADKGEELPDFRHKIRPRAFLTRGERRDNLALINQASVADLLPRRSASARLKAGAGGLLLALCRVA
jgi:hypothetical protein